MDIEALFITALQNLKMGEWEDAASGFAQILALDPRYADAFAYRGMSNWNQNKHDEAILDINEAIRLAPDNPLFYFFRGRITRSIDDYTRAIELDPFFFSAYNRRAVEYMWAKENIRAIADYDKSLEIIPEAKQHYLSIPKPRRIFLANPDAPVILRYIYVERARCREGIGDKIGAFSDYVRGIKLRSSPFIIWDKPIKIVGSPIRPDLEEVLSHNPDFTDAYILRAFLTSDSKAAVNDFTMAIQLTPQEADLYYYRSIRYAELNDLENALRDLNRTIDLQANYVDALVGRGFLYYDQEKISEALNDFERAVNLVPHHERAGRMRYLLRQHGRLERHYRRS